MLSNLSKITELLQRGAGFKSKSVYPKILLKGDRDWLF